MDPLEIVYGVGGAGAAITALSYAVKKLADRHVSPPEPPRIEPPHPSTSGHMRAVSDTLLHQRAEEIARQREIDRASIETRDLLRDNNAILMAIAEAIESEIRHRHAGGTPQPGAYRMKLPSNRGGE